MLQFYCAHNKKSKDKSAWLNFLTATTAAALLLWPSAELYAQASPTTSATVVVAASDSKQSSKDNADYVCDGTADEVEIENALADLATAGSGEVVLMEGTYDIDDTINIDTELTGIRFMPGAKIKWSDTSSSEPLISIEESNTYLTYPRVEGSSNTENPRTRVGIMVGGQVKTVHGVQIYSPRCRFLDAGIEFGIVGSSSSGDNQVWGGRIDKCNVGIRSRGFVNRVYAPFISFCDVGIHCTDDRSSQKIEVYGATINQSTNQSILVDRGKDSIFYNLWLETTDEGLTPDEMIEVGTSTYEVYNCTFAGNTNMHLKAHDYAVTLTNSRGLRFENMLVSTNDFDNTTTTALINEASTSSGLDNRFGRITFYPGDIPAHTVLDKDGTGEVIVEMPPDVEDSQEGTTVGHVAPPSDADYLVVRQGDTYYAKQSNGHVPVVSETLKDVIDEIKASDTAVRFAAGTFDFGTITAGSEQTTYLELDNIQFLGAGRGVTTLQNTSTLTSADTEVFSFTRCDGVLIRDMTVSAGGTSDSSSDAIDFDAGSNCLIENVEVIASRGSGIVFDGKEIHNSVEQQASNNRVVGCYVTGCQYSGIKLLAADHNVISDCFVWGNTDHGILIDKASSVADQANKPSDYNTVTDSMVFENGEHGVFLRSSNYNKLSNLTIQNNADQVSSRDGIRITTSDSTPSVGNIITGCVATDDQGTKTQTYGVRLLVGSGAIDYTVIGDNYLRGNLTGTLSDGGTNTQTSNNAQ
jgi:parallel beta-helix repeat protein